MSRLIGRLVCALLIAFPLLTAAAGVGVRAEEADSGQHPPGGMDVEFCVGHQQPR